MHDFENVLTYQLEKRRPRGGRQAAVHGSIHRASQKSTTKSEEGADAVLGEALDDRHPSKEQPQGGTTVNQSVTAPNKVVSQGLPDLPSQQQGELDQGRPHSDQQGDEPLVLPNCAPSPCLPSPELDHLPDSGPETVSTTPTEKNAVNGAEVNHVDRGAGNDKDDDSADLGKREMGRPNPAETAFAGIVTEPEIVTPAQQIGVSLRLNHPSGLAQSAQVPPSTAAKSDGPPSLFRSTPVVHSTPAVSQKQQFRSPPPRPTTAFKKRKESVQKGSVGPRFHEENGSEDLLNIDMTKYGPGPLVKRPPTCPPLFKSGGVIQPGKARQVAAINNQYYSHERSLVSMWTPIAHRAEGHAKQSALFNNASFKKPVDEGITTILQNDNIITNTPSSKTPCPSQLGTMLEWACRQLSSKN